MVQNSIQITGIAFSELKPEKTHIFVWLLILSKLFQLMDIDLKAKELYVAKYIEQKQTTRQYISEPAYSDQLN